MLGNSINKTYIQLEIDYDGVITSIISGDFLQQEFKIGNSIYTSCSFLEVTLEALNINQFQTIEGMVIASLTNEFNIDVELFKADSIIEVLLINRSNVYNVVNKLNQDRNDLFLMKSQLAKQNIELERLRNLADRSNKEKSQFLAVMSHEIRTPLNSILGFAEVIESETTNPKTKEYINLLLNASENLKIIVNDILDLSHIEANKLELVNEPISLQEVIKFSIKNFISQSRNNTVELSYLLSDKIPNSVIGDSVRLTQILSNLIGNALKFTKKGSIIVKVDTVKEDLENVVISIDITDTGRGMAKKNLEKIFKAYEQAELNDSRLYGGVGLGLSIVKHLVESMNGKIQVTSKIDVGSTFLIEIPFQKTKTHNKEGENEFIDDKKFEGLEILLADDDKLNQILINHVFGKVNAKITLANDGIEALQQLNNKSFDIVLLDINMPNMSGKDVIKEKGSFLKNSETPIIAVTANASKIEIDGYLASGFSSFIAKPHTHSKLKKVIASLIN